MATKKKEVLKNAEEKKTTTVKKELRVRQALDGRHQEIYYEQGGQVPDALLGKFTSNAVALGAIAQYTANK